MNYCGGHIHMKPPIQGNSGLPALKRREEGFSEICKRWFPILYAYHNHSGAISRRTPNPSITNPLINLSHRPSCSCNLW